MTEKDEEAQYNTLVTRAREYEIQEETFTSSTPKPKILKRNSNFLKCKEHSNIANLRWETINENCKSCLNFEMKLKLKNGVLPRNKDVLEYLLTIKMDSSGQHNSNNHERQCAMDVILQWIYCNVYPTTITPTAKKIKEMFEEYKHLKKYPNNKKGNAYWQRFENFVEQQHSLFDIIATEDRIKVQQKIWGVKMNDKDHKFYTNQKKNPPKGYCDTAIDRKWKITKSREDARKNRSRNESYEQPNPHEEYGICDVTTDEDYIASEDDDPMSNDTSYRYTTTTANNLDDLPLKFRHIRNGPRSVKPEIYKLMNKLSSEFHMSRAQVEAAIVNTANILFGRKWKAFQPKGETDCDTLPAMSSLRRTEPYMEAMALCTIVEDIMKEGAESTIVYSNDGSALSGTGNYIVQSLTVNGKQRSLPTFGIFTESKESLKDLEVTTLEILSASTGNKYSTQEIFNKISFVMTDSTSHNLGVVEMVATDLETDEVPKTLLCNVHPLMMFQNKIKAICQKMHDTLGKQKINDCFLVDVEFKNESFVIKAVKCLSNFINRDYSAKPWNRQKHFEEFIKPKKNESLSLKDHRFNRLGDCCLSLVHHIDDIARYLEKFDNIINGITILDRSFVDMEILKPIFASIALLGVHITRPFHTLLMDADTNYTTLLQSFSTLYNDLTTISPKHYLNCEKVCNFVCPDLFKQSLPSQTLLDSLKVCMMEYPQEIEKIMSLALKEFASGFSHQKEAIFGFGPTAAEDTGHVLKISTLSEDEMKVLDKVMVHNIGEERNVGLCNFEVSLRGKENLTSVSRKMILNRSADLIDEREPGDFKNFRKEAAAIKEINLKWNKKMQELEAKGYSEKERVNSKKEATKIKDLDFLKSQTMAGPFTSKEEVQAFMMSCVESKEKNIRMYKEVRFARKTCLSLKETSSVFRLRSGGKNLPTQVYADNLCQYLDDSTAVTTLTMSDFNNVLTAMQGEAFASTITESGDESDDDCNGTEMKINLAVGEHVAAFWIDELNKPGWYLGVVDSVSETSTSISYMKQTDQVGCSWAFPEDAEVRQTAYEQILERDVKVEYRCTSIIRCYIPLAIAEALTEEMLALQIRV